MTATAHTLEELEEILRLQFNHTLDRSRFRSSLNKVMRQELPIEFRIAPPFKYFRSKNKRQFKLMIVNKKTKKCRLLMRSSCEEVYLNNPEIKGLVKVVRDATCKTSFAELAYIIGKLFESEFVKRERCTKCNGTGYLPHYAHIMEGICFRCLGTGGKLIILKQSEKG